MRAKPAQPPRLAPRNDSAWRVPDHTGAASRILAPMVSWLPALKGRIEERTINSAALHGNHLGDAHERPVWVYLPPAYDTDQARRFPSIYVIQGYTGQLFMWANHSPFRRNTLQQVDDVFADSVDPCIVVFVDAWTKYGGSQYVDSPGTGRYHSYLCDDVVSFIDAHYRTIPSAASRAITGKSSGGFGAMITPMLRPDLFGALATHAGDALYEACYLAEFAQAARALRAYDHDIWAWWEDFQGRNGIWAPGDPAVVTALGCSAAFSASDDGTPQLPFDPRTGVVHPEVWQRWLDWDPVRMVDCYADSLRGLHSIWIDAGTSDEYYLDLGAEAFRAGLDRISVAPDRVQFELVAGKHGDMHWRYPMAMQWLAGRLARD